jgi:hypothetical protein
MISYMACYIILGCFDIFIFLTPLAKHVSRNTETIDLSAEEPTAEQDSITIRLVTRACCASTGDDQAALASPPRKKKRPADLSISGPSL